MALSEAWLVFTDGTPNWKPLLDADRLVPPEGWLMLGAFGNWKPPWDAVTVVPPEDWLLDAASAPNWNPPWAAVVAVPPKGWLVLTALGNRGVVVGAWCEHRLDPSTNDDVAGTPKDD